MPLNNLLALVALAIHVIKAKFLLETCVQLIKEKVDTFKTIFHKTKANQFASIGDQ